MVMTFEEFCNAKEESYRKICRYYIHPKKFISWLSKTIDEGVLSDEERVRCLSESGRRVMLPMLLKYTIYLKEQQDRGLHDYII